MTTAEIRELESRYGIPTYAQLPIAVVGGDGSWVTDADGRRWLDLYGGHAVALTGHCHPRVVKAIQDQAGKLLFYSNVVANDARARALRSIAGIAPKGFSRTFLCNSGSEANEAAIKIARRTTGRRRVVSMINGFHGRTMGSLSATALGHYLADYAPGVPDHEFIPFGDLAAAERAITDTAAGILLEPIQSMGGMWTATAEYLRGLRALCDRHGTLLMFDEVQTGPGRTGAWWYGENFDVQPDVITTAKGLGSGVPVAAVIASDAVAAKVKEGDQGTTFGGGPLACAAVEATIAVLRDEHLVENAAARGAQIADAVRSIAGVTGMRGRGLLSGIVLDRDAGPVVKALRGHGILAGSTPGDAKVLRLLPPLVLTESEVETFARALHAVMKGA
ncbi:MAG: aminotransferase class III-fold pyridoxal phosphate-dependent enzyme [Planctomycetes bacterium]|nr:aminotransferase class III-fold pyridoxal phosphate-dependent enzyme [Planctomycetota bacterium]